MDTPGNDHARWDRMGNGGHVGALLRATRERLGEPLDVAAEALRIRESYLRAIEDGRSQDLPGPAYAVGFVRAYADHLGLHAEEVVRRFKDESQSLKRTASLEFPVPDTEGGLPSGALVLLALILAGAAYGAWYWVANSDRPVADLIPDIPDRLAAILPTAEPPPPPGTEATGPASGLAPAVPALAPAAPSSDAPSLRSETRTEPPEPAPDRSSPRPRGADPAAGAAAGAPTSSGADEANSGPGAPGAAPSESGPATGEDGSAAAGAVGATPGGPETMDDRAPHTVTSEAGVRAILPPPKPVPTAAESAAATGTEPPPAAPDEAATAPTPDPGARGEEPAREDQPPARAGSTMAEAGGVGASDPGAPGGADPQPGDAGPPPSAARDGAGTDPTAADGPAAPALAPQSGPDRDAAAPDGGMAGVAGQVAAGPSSSSPSSSPSSSALPAGSSSLTPAEDRAAVSAPASVSAGADPGPPAAAGSPATGPDATATATASLPAGATTEAPPSAEAEARAGDTPPPPPPAEALDAQPRQEAFVGRSAPGEVMDRAGGARIVLRATSNSWIMVRQGSDLVVRRLLRAGDVYPVPSSPNLSLNVSNAGALEVYVDGKRAPALGPNGGVRNNIPLTPSVLKSGL